MRTFSTSWSFGGDRTSPPASQSASPPRSDGHRIRCGRSRARDSAALTDNRPPTPMGLGSRAAAPRDRQPHGRLWRSLSLFCREPQRAPLLPSSVGDTAGADGARAVRNWRIAAALGVRQVTSRVVRSPADGVRQKVKRCLAEWRERVCRYLICGSRTYTNDTRVRQVLAERDVGPGDVVIHGGARGADRLAHCAGEDAGAEVMVFRAEWDRLGKGAGAARNQRMLDEGAPEFVLAFVDKPLVESRGTADMVRRARAAGLHGCVFIDRRTS